MPDRSKIVNIWKNRAACLDCGVSEICLPYGLDELELKQLMSVVVASPPINRGKYVFRIGDPIRSLFAVRSGSVKVAMPTEGGEEQVLGFILPGELLGFDGVDTQQHVCEAVALETTSLCELPFDRLEEVCMRLPRLDHEVHRMFGREISNEHTLLLLLGKKSADERLAAFLASLSGRFKRRGFSEREFNLTMSRKDIGNYLGLAVETVSRVLSHLQQQGLLEMKGRFVRILDLERLAALAGEEIPHHTQSQTQ